MSLLPDLTQKEFSREDIATILAATEVGEINKIRVAAEDVLLKHCGAEVYMRGLVEASNVCRCDCFYCGIRKSNKTVTRYDLGVDELVSLAQQCVAFGYGSMVIQTGERSDKKFIDNLETAIHRIKNETCGDNLPQGLGITLSVGEQTKETYRRFFEAGAHRYLLRIETTNPELFAQIHPPEQRIETRLECLRTLREVGYQVGTGVMIGLPGQSIEDLANDIMFFKTHDIAMIGMGPFIPHEQTPLWGKQCPDEESRLRLGLLMIAATRLVLRDVNIAATTALQAIDPQGREKALRFGANVMMPMMTPENVRLDYLLYPNKPNLNENAANARLDMEAFLKNIGRNLGLNKWGDAPHATK